MIKGETNKAEEWSLVLNRFKLMPNVHAECGANDIFTITKEMVFSF
jgi:hypothetical protein